MKHLKLKLTIFIAALFALTLVLASCTGGSGTGTVKLYDGGEELYSCNVTSGEAYSFPTPTKTGYTFIGWYSAANGGAVYTDATGSSLGRVWGSDCPSVLYAHWEANEYTITFNYGNMELTDPIESITVTYGDSLLGDIHIPTLEGYDFIGWYNESNNGTMLIDAEGNFVEGADVYTNNSYKIGTDGTTLYARFKEKTVTFKFITEGSEVSDLVVKMSDIIHSLPSSIRDGFCFVGWYFDANGHYPLSYPYEIPTDSEGEITLYARFAEASGVLTYTLISSTGDKEYEVSYRGDAERLVIPDTYNGKPVTKIASISSSTLVSVVLPESITTLGAAAFKDCSALESINLPSSLKVISDNAFSGCVSLGSIYIPKSVETIGKYAFAYCSSITSIHLYENVSSIGSGAFRNMSSLAAITVSENNETYYSKDGVLYRGVGTSAYLIQYPAARELNGFVIDSNVTKIEAYAFSASRIEYIEIGGKVSSIGEGAFNGCHTLSSVYLTSTATSITIGNGAFRDCPMLKAFKTNCENVPTLNNNVFDGVASNFTVYVPSARVKNYQVASNWRNLDIYSFNDIIGDFAVEEVEGGYKIRQYFGTATELVIEDMINGKNIVSIGEGAFSCSALEMITISANVTSIGREAFKDCEYLVLIYMNGAPPALGADAFAGIDEAYRIYATGHYDEYAAAAGWADIIARIYG